MAQAKHPPSATVKKSKPAKVAKARIQSDVPESVLVLEKNSRFAEQDEVLKKFRKKRRDNADAVTIKRIEASGGKVYTHAEVSERFGVDIDPEWTQAQLQDYAAVAAYVQPIVKIQQKAKEAARAVALGRKKVLATMSETYANYLACIKSPRRYAIFKALRNELFRNGITAHRDAPDASILTRYVLMEFDPKQVHTHSKALEYAAKHNIAPVDFSTFVKEKQGFEKIRTLALQESPEYQQRATNNGDIDALISEWFDVEKEDPFLTVLNLTRDQCARLKSDDFTEVVLIGTLEGDALKLYARLPKTEKLEKGISDAVLTAAGNDLQKLRDYIGRRKTDAVGRKARLSTDIYGYQPRPSQEGLEQQKGK